MTTPMFALDSGRDMIDTIPPMGNEIAQIVAARNASPTGGGDIMSALIGLVGRGSRGGSSMPSHSASSSSAGPAIAAGVGGLALGAVAAAALASKGSDKGRPEEKKDDKKPMDAKKPEAGTPPGGSPMVVKEPTLAPVDPKKYSGFEDGPGKGTTIVLGESKPPTTPKTIAINTPPTPDIDAVNPGGITYGSKMGPKP